MNIADHHLKRMKWLSDDRRAAGVFDLPRLNRRRFLQFVGAASLMPVMPAIPARAAATSGAASASKALWAGIYANSGSSANFVRVAKGMGLSNTAIQGVGARSVGTRISIAAIEKLGQMGTQTARSTLLPKAESTGLKRTIKQRLERLLTPDVHEPETIVAQDNEATPEEDVEVSAANKNDNS